MKRNRLLSCLALVLLSGCPAEQPEPDSSHAPDIFDPPPSVDRWYRPDQVDLGQEIYLRHCQVCHRVKGQGAPDWRKPLADGHFPPPPLDGSAHAWHHPMRDLLQTVANGLNHMPAFKHKLSLQDRQAVIAYIQSLWSDETYNLWHARVESPDLKKRSQR